MTAAGQSDLKWCPSCQQYRKNVTKKGNSRRCSYCREQAKKRRQVYA